MTLRCAAAGALKAMCRSSGMQDAMRTSPVITIQGRTRSWKISSSPPIAPSSPVTERTNTASSSSDSERMFNCMHVGGAVSGSDESEDEGEEDRGLGTTNLERMSLTSHKKKENESPSPVPKDASTSAWERLMQPDPMSLPSPSKGLPWGPKGSHESFADLDVDAHDDDENDCSVRVVSLSADSISAALQQQQQQQQQQQRAEAGDKQADVPLSSPELA